MYKNTYYFNYQKENCFYNVFSTYKMLLQCSSYIRCILAAFFQKKKKQCSTLLLLCIILHV